MEAFSAAALRELLEQAKAADPDRKQSDCYEWNPPVSQTDLEAFEQEIGTTLPETYRRFLLEAGNGGAGPFCGLFSLQQVRGWLDWKVEPEECPFLRPGMDADVAQWLWNDGENWKRGCIPIGSEGDTYFTLLLVAGPNRGRVVYVEYEASWVFFPEEPDFLCWYTRWLREVALGYKIFWFATNLDGDEQALRGRYRRAETDEERWAAVASMEKFPVLSPESVELICAEVQKQLTVPDACGVLELLYFASAEQYHWFLDSRWKSGRCAAVVREVSYSLLHLPVEDKALAERWRERVLEQLPDLPQESWLAAVQLLRKSGGVRLAQVLFLLERAEGRVKRELLRSFSRFPDAKEHLELWLPRLAERDDLELLCVVLNTVPRTADARLREALYQVQKDFAFAVGLLLHVDRKDPEAVRRANRRRLENEVYRYACAAWRDAFREAINPEVAGVPRPYFLEMEHHDIRDLGMDRLPPPGCIRLNPLIALAIREQRGRLPSTAYDWRRALERMKKLTIKLTRSTVRAWDEEGHRVFVYAPDEHFPPEPFFYDLRDWSAIGRMQSLRTLCIEELCVDDFSFLAECKNVETLSLRGTNFSDCRLLREMPRLKRVNLNLCPLTHQDALADLSIEFLTGAENS